MSCPFHPARGGPSRRGLLAGAGGLLAGAGLGKVARAAAPEAPVGPLREAFFGQHQGGIATPAQTNSYLVAFDLAAKTRRSTR